MSAIASTAFWVAEGRSEGPGGPGGVLIIVGVVLALVALAVLAHWLIDRYGQTKRKSLERDAHQPGEVGRVGKWRGP